MANLTGGSNELQWAGLGILSSALRGSVPRVRVPTERVAGAAASNVKAIATSHALFLSAGLDDRPMLTWPNIAKHWPAHDVGHNVLWALTGGVNEILVTQSSLEAWAVWAVISGGTTSWTVSAIARRACPGRAGPKARSGWLQSR